MLESVITGNRTLNDYCPIVGEETVQNLRTMAEPLRGARVLHVNATPFGGGVAEILSSLVPLMNNLGIETGWKVISGSEEFFNVTKAMHNILQGMDLNWTTDMERIWLSCNDMNAERFDQCYDFVIVHDPQPAGLLEGVLRRNGHCPPGTWLWQCHLDTSNSSSYMWDFIRPFVQLYKAAIFTRQIYAAGNAPGNLPVFTIWPAIDPLSTKNMMAPSKVMKRVLSRCCLDCHRPILCQISRFDPWKDPLGVMDVYREVKKEVPGLQLVLAGSLANDDPEGQEYYDLIRDYSGKDIDIHVFHNLSEVSVGSLEVGVLQRAASVVIQKSIREGFGLTVTEALWKGRPVVAGNVGGIPLQVEHGRTGFLANSTDEYVAYIIYLLRHPEIAEHMGLAAKKHVQQNFLITRALGDYLRTLDSLEHSKESSITSSEAIRDNFLPA